VSPGGVLLRGAVVVSLALQAAWGYGNARKPGRR
jgi:hypothetical protein